MDIEMRERSSRHRDSAGRKKNQSPRPLLSTSPYTGEAAFAQRWLANNLVEVVRKGSGTMQSATAGLQLLAHCVPHEGAPPKCGFDVRVANRSMVMQAPQRS